MNVATKVGTSEKQDAGEVARIGFKAMMEGDGDVVAGLKNKVQSAIATVTPSAVLAEQHRKNGGAGLCKAVAAGEPRWPRIHHR